jgi:hypothetical protein
VLNGEKQVHTEEQHIEPETATLSSRYDRRPADARATMGTTESPKIGGAPVTAQAASHQVEDKIEISQSQKQEWAARIHQHNRDMRRADEPRHSDRVMPNMSPSVKQIGVDEDEEEAMIIDRGWLQAVNILIQLADIILVS